MLHLAMSCDECRPRQLCSYHLQRAYDFTRGLADGRGVAWADRVASKVAWQLRCRTWPATPKMMAIARRIVAELGYDDPRLLDMLAQSCADHAAKRWARIGRRLVERALES